MISFDSGVCVCVCVCVFVLSYTHVLTTPVHTHAYTRTHTPQDMVNRRLPPASIGGFIVYDAHKCVCSVLVLCGVGLCCVCVC